MLKPNVIFPTAGRAGQRYDASIRFFRVDAAGRTAEIVQAGNASQRRAELDALDRRFAAQARALDSRPGAVLRRGRT